MDTQASTTLQDLAKELAEKRDLIGYQQLKNTQKQPSKKITSQFDIDDVIRILQAKNEWETSVDSLDSLVIVILDKDLNIIRANKTIELWNWGEVNTVKGIHISDFIDPVISEDTRYYFYRTWVELDGVSTYEWESKYNTTSNTLRFTFYPAKTSEVKYSDNVCPFYVLVIDDLSQRKKTEKNLKEYVSELEYERLIYSQKLEYANKQLENKLKKEKISRKKIQESEKRLQTLSKQLIDAQEDERRRVAIELHDGIGQILGAVKYQVEGILLAQKNSTDTEQSSLRNDFDEVIKNILSAMHEVKRVSMNLRPTMLDEIGVIKTLRWFFEDFKKIYKHNIDFECNLTEDDIFDTLKVVIFRIVQESMNNIAKHADATSISVKLKYIKNGIILRIMDDGKGFADIDKKKEKMFGLGLKSMKERSESSGAIFSIKSGIGQGTIVQAIWLRQVAYI